MARGDHIYVKRLGGVYTHHGIDIGGGEVIHFTGEPGSKANAAITKTNIQDFSLGSEVKICTYGKSDGPDTVVQRAKSRLGETGYNLGFNNCEHFAAWCKTGKPGSEQVERTAGVTGGGVGAGAAVAGGIGTVGAVGAAAGLSGPGIMSGLATIGGVVGGGAVAGIAVVGAAPAVITSGAMVYVLRDKEYLPETERKARRAGRYSTVVGGAGGTIASVGAVASMGTAVGLSAPGITSGLAAVGGLVGGGMAAGVVVTAAAPAVVAAGTGYLAYQAWKWFNK